MYRIRIKRGITVRGSDPIYAMRMHATQAFGKPRTQPGSSYWGEVPDLVESRYGTHADWVARTDAGQLWLMLNAPAGAIIVEEG